MPDLSDATSGRFVGVVATAVTLVLFGLISVLPLTDSARTLAFVLLGVVVLLGALAVLAVQLIRHQSRPISERPEELETNEDW